MTSARKIRGLARVLAPALLMAVSTSGALAQGTPMDIGKSEYEAACAVCHGLSGKGGGPVAAKLALAVPDLTVLARNNRGVFPFDRV